MRFGAGRLPVVFGSMPNLLSSRRIFPLDCNESVTAEAFTLSTRWGRRSQFQDQPQDVDEESSRNADFGIWNATYRPRVTTFVPIAPSPPQAAWRRSAPSSPRRRASACGHRSAARTRVRRRGHRGRLRGMFLFLLTASDVESREHARSALWPRVVLTTVDPSSVIGTCRHSGVQGNGRVGHILAEG
jgi:hypothetical protein